MIKCPKCGIGNKSGSLACTKCGTAFQGCGLPEEPLAPVKRKSKSKNIKGSKYQILNNAAAVSLVLLCLGILLMVVEFNTSTTEAPESKNPSSNSSTSVSSGASPGKTSSASGKVSPSSKAAANGKASPSSQASASAKASPTKLADSSGIVVEADNDSETEDTLEDALVLQLPHGQTMTMILCVSGPFDMGSPDTELGRYGDEELHRVILTRGFYMSKYEVTQAQYKAVMGSNPSGFKGDLNRPVEQVSWDMAVEYCKKVNKLCRSQLPPGYKVSLPTEAQWERACRASTTTALNTETELTSVDGTCRNLDSVAWYDENSGDETHPVGAKRPNRWGLYDMHGNVREWCSDNFDVYAGTMADPVGASYGENRMVRGGSWYDCAAFCRSAYRSNDGHLVKNNYTGFRVAVTVARKAD